MSHRKLKIIDEVIYMLIIISSLSIRPFVRARLLRTLCLISVLRIHLQKSLIIKYSVSGTDYPVASR